MNRANQLGEEIAMIRREQRELNAAISEKMAELAILRSQEEQMMSELLGQSDLFVELV